MWDDAAHLFVYSLAVTLGVMVGKTMVTRANQVVDSAKTASCSM